MLIYLPTEELIMDLHENILQVSKGRSGIKDARVIHAAVNRPKTYLAYHDTCDIHTVCAVIMDSIARNHGFTDGNKRTGLMSAILTYELNDITLDLRRADGVHEFEELVLWVVTEKPEIPQIAKRLKELTDEYRVSGVSKFVSALRSLITPYNSND
jgi:death-on-curing protein